MPEPPPHFETVAIRADVDPLSYSLYHILEMKDFLLHRVQLKQAFFTGWSVGSVILHFFITSDDMEAAERRLKSFSEELQKLKVASVEAIDRFSLHLSNAQPSEVRMQVPSLLNSS